MEFTKPPKTYVEQIDLMECRGLAFPDRQSAESYLNHISYYRLSAYAIPFQQTKDVFDKGSTFDDLLNLYLFDRELRLIVFDAIERIEVAIRAKIMYELAHKYGSHWQDDPNIFVPPYTNRAGIAVDIFGDIQNTIKEHCTAKRPEVFIQHYVTTYTKPSTPPSWMCIELLTVGQLSRLYSALKDNTDKNSIANYFGLHHALMQSWLHALTYVRNICGHHSRLWNRDFAIQPDIPRKPPTLPWMVTKMRNNKRCFFFLCVLKYFLQTINPDGHFKKRLTDLFAAYPKVPVMYLGIPTDVKGNLIDWQAEPLWS